MLSRIIIITIIVIIIVITLFPLKSDWQRRAELLVKRLG